jgi:hypothetical protein
MNQENNTAWITSCKSQESGWIVNGNMGVPNDPANQDCADVIAWIAEGNTPEPEFTDAESAANAQSLANFESLTYLASTDWYVIRSVETGVPLPTDVLELRAAARLVVVN